MLAVLSFEKLSILYKFFLNDKELFKYEWINDKPGISNLLRLLHGKLY